MTTSLSTNPFSCRPPDTYAHALSSKIWFEKSLSGDISKHSDNLDFSIETLESILAVFYKYLNVSMGIGIVIEKTYLLSEHSQLIHECWCTSFMHYTTPKTSTVLSLTVLNILGRISHMIPIVCGVAHFQNNLLHA